MKLRVESLRARPLRVALTDPFVIASGRIVETRAGLIECTLVDLHTGRRATGLGEAAALPPITHEDLDDILVAACACERALVGATFDSYAELPRPLPALAERPVTAAAVECALLDAEAQLRGVAVWKMLAQAGVAPVTVMRSDITIPIHAPAYMGELALRWRARGFTCFKVKVGLDLASDLEALSAIARSVPDGSLRLDANGGYGAADAVTLYERATLAGAVIECFEQPCARDDLAGMIAVTRALPTPVIADESVRSRDDLALVIDRSAARGVNLKLVKSHGPLEALAIGRMARAAGLRVMFGAMVETRLGITAAAHACASLGGADYVDLDTAWLLQADPFIGGYAEEGPTITLNGDPGYAISFAG